MAGNTQPFSEHLALPAAAAGFAGRGSFHGRGSKGGNSIVAGAGVTTALANPDKLSEFDAFWENSMTVFPLSAELISKTPLGKCEGMKTDGDLREGMFECL